MKFNTKQELYDFLNNFDFNSKKEVDLASVYFLVKYDGYTEPIYFTKYEDVWFPSPCALRNFPLKNEELSDYVKEMYEDTSFDKSFEYEKLFQKDNVHYEIDTPQCTPFLPEQTEIISIFTETQCLNYLINKNA